jgi:hypothetical protein
MRVRLIIALFRWAERIKASRPPDVVIGGEENPYLLRWHILPQNNLFNIYLHEFRRSDDDRALHDHKYPNLSILLDGMYLEHRIRAGGIHTRELCCPGTLKARRGSTAHRVELVPHPVTGDPVRCTTLFLTSFKTREWGFHCPHGWRHWTEFCADNNYGRVGKGCN